MNNAFSARDGCAQNLPFLHYLYQHLYNGLLRSMVDGVWMDASKAVNGFNFATQLRVKSRFLCDGFFTITTLSLWGFSAVTIVISNQAA